MAAYRPPGRSNRSGRSQTDNDVFEGLPVKQWNQSFTRISLAPPKPEVAEATNDRWAEPPMPRDSHMLHPWTQHLLKLARAGKVGTKRKADADGNDDDKQDDESAEEPHKRDLEDRGFQAKKWKPVPESMLAPEHKHFEFIAKRRKGLPSFYGPDAQDYINVPMRSIKVKRANAEGVFFVYDVQVPEGQTMEGELPSNMTPEEIAALPPTATVGPGTVIEGLGVANDEGVFIAEHLKPAGSAPRRNRPPPKKKGGPGRGKKRVTFTNPDGSTYTTIVPNATKIIPQPGQTIRHVAKGEEAMADVSKEEAARIAAANQQNQQDAGEGEGDDGENDDGENDEGDDEDDDEEGDDDDDDREDGELSDEEAPADSTLANGTPAPPQPAEATTKHDTSKVTEKLEAKAEPELSVQANPEEPQDAVMTDASASQAERDVSSSPELPLARNSHSRQPSLAEPGDVPALDLEKPEESNESVQNEPNGDGGDLLGNLEKHLESEQQPNGGA